MESILVAAGAFGLVLAGLYGTLTGRSMMRALLALNIVGTGINLTLVALAGGTGPWIDRASNSASSPVDPIPQTMAVLSMIFLLGITAIVLALVSKRLRPTPRR